MFDVLYIASVFDVLYIASVFDVLYIANDLMYYQAHNQTFLKGDSKSGMVTQMKWGHLIVSYCAKYNQHV